eukprot:jgi/Orpsp1_1/1184759/evm.model.c7180000090882.1
MILNLHHLKKKLWNKKLFLKNQKKLNNQLKPLKLRKKLLKFHQKFQVKRSL